MCRHFLLGTSLLGLVAMNAQSAPRPKDQPVGPVRIDFTPLDGQRAPDFMLAVKVEQDGKPVYYQAFEVSGPAQPGQMAQSMGDALKRAEFQAEASGGMLAVTGYKGNGRFTLSLEVTGLPKDAPKAVVERIEKPGGGK